MSGDTSGPLNVIQIITQRRFSGAERMCLALSEGLQRRGHHVVIACKPLDAMLRSACERGLETYLPRMSGKLNLLAPFLLAELVRRTGADIVHTHLSTAAMWGSLAGRLAGVPVVAHVHAMNSKCFYVAADLVIACSQGVRDHLVRQGMDPAKVRVVHNGVETQRFTSVLPPQEVRASLALPPGLPVIGCVASLSRRKGQQHLLRAVASLRPKWPGLQCLLIGEGDTRAPLSSLAARLGIADQVRFLGYRADAIDLMNVMDVLVLPSVAKEGLGLVLVEAAMLGKPTIASDAPGINEAILRDQSGFLVPPADPEALASRLDTLLADRALRTRMGAVGRAYASATFNLDAMAAQTEAIYHELLRRRCPAGQAQSGSTSCRT